MSYYVASVLQCESSYGNKKVFPFAISTTLSLYVASVVQRLALNEKNRKEQNQNQCWREARAKHTIPNSH